MATAFESVLNTILPKRETAKPDEDGRFWYWGHPIEHGVVNTEISMWLAADRNPRRIPGFIGFTRPTQPQYGTKTIQAVMEHSTDLDLWREAVKDKGEYFGDHLQTTVIINSGHAAELIVALLRRIEELEGE